MHVQRRSDGVWQARPASSGDRLRVAVLCSDDPHHAYLVSRAAQDLDLVGVIVEPGSSQQRRLWVRHAWVDATARAYQARRQRLTGRASYRRRYFSPLTSHGGFQAAEVLRVDWINSLAAHRHLVELQPDVTIVCGTTYLRSNIIEAAGLMVNIHGGYLPHYKGNHCIFFAFLRKDYERIGATLHLVSPRLDGGELIEAVRPEIYPHDNDEHLYDRAIQLAIDRLVALLFSFEAGTSVLRSQPQEEIGETFRHRSRQPQLDLWVWLRRRLRLEQVPHLLGQRGLAEPPVAPAPQREGPTSASAIS